MRKTLYFKDEDYRLSFLHGAYVTLTTLREADIRRITRLRLSPLYVSVHATDPEVRRLMLGIRRDDRLLEKIDRLTAEGILLHAQIVVCPDINDGSTLEKTIGDLRKRHPGIQSLAVVPLGMTKHRQGLCPLRPVDAEHARQIIALVERFRKIYRDEAGSGFVYCSDEWYIRAGREIPGLEYYDDFPQIENGVGMVRDFLDAADRLDTLEAFPRYQGNITLVTGVSMSGYIREFAGRLSLRTGGKIRTVIVENDFYGHSATVSGLLTGGDIIRALEGTGAGETIVLPPNCLNHEGLFLDDLTPDDIAKTYGVHVKQAEWDPVSTFFDAGKDKE